MGFKEYLRQFEEWFSKGKVEKSLFKPGPRDSKHKPHDIVTCGQGGGPGPCNVAGGLTATPATPMK